VRIALLSLSLCAYAALAGCGPEFDPASLILDERVLAIKAEPPEAVPGETVRLTPLVAAPDGTLEEGAGYEATWWRCPDDESTALADEERCDSADARLDLGAGAPLEHVIDPEIFGPLPPPEDQDGSPNEKLLGAALGYWRVLGLTMTAGERRVEAFKRVVVFGSRQPLGDLDPRLADLDPRVEDNGEVIENTNPLLTSVQVREGTPDGGTVTELEPGGTYWFVPGYSQDVLQAYWSLKMDLDGLDLQDPESVVELDEDELLSRFERVRRCELPVFSWYVTAGKLRRETTVDETVTDGVYAAADVTCPEIEGEPRQPAVRFTAPSGDDVPDDGVVHAWVVLRDGRGGTDFRSFDLTIAQ
jgi:hypothetical protein